jgi:2-keto-4-pentenoate hydratase
LLLTGCGAWPDRRAAIVEDLLRARQTTRATEPPAARYVDLTVEDAYEVQDALVERLRADGARVTGYKGAYASKAAQQAFGMSGPAYGVLLSSHAVPSGGELRAGDFIRFHIETEVVFKVGKDITRPVKDVAELKQYIVGVYAGFDIPDMRYGQAKAGAADVICDNCGAHNYVVGEGLPAGAVDAPRLNVRLLYGGKEVAAGPASAVMDDPWNSALWLANFLLQREHSLKEGDVIFTGAVWKAFLGQDGEVRGAYEGEVGNMPRIAVKVK